MYEVREGRETQTPKFMNNIKRWLYTMIIVGFTLTGISLIVRPEGVIPKNIYDWVASSTLGGIGISVMLICWISLLQQIVTRFKLDVVHGDKGDKTMSDIGFDVRPYCERLAEVSDRFEFCTDTGVSWSLTDATNGAVLGAMDWPDEEMVPETKLWAFFGPLADERKIRPHGYDRDGRPGTFVFDGITTWLESIIAAVVESFESEVTP